MIVDQARYRDGTREECQDIGEAMAAIRADDDGPGDFLWVGLKDPSQETFDRVVGDQLAMHPLAVEDAVQGDQRPKVERYGDGSFAVIRPLRYDQRTRELESGELMVFLDEHVLLTVRRGEAVPLGGLRHALERGDAGALRQGPWGVFHAIVDHVVDEYLEIEDLIQDDLDDFERRLFSEHAHITSGQIYRLKREVQEFKRAAVPLHRALKMLLGPASPLTDHETRLQMRDVTDHLELVIDNIESQDRLLTDMISVHLSQVGVRQNQDMRTISAWAAVVAVPTLVAGVYGMNFDGMPELSASVRVGGREVYYGYYVAVAVMLLVCGWLYVQLRRAGWIGSGREGDGEDSGPARTGDEDGRRHGRRSSAS